MIERKVTAMTEIDRRDNGGQIERYTPPTPDQVVELLQLAAAYDKRTFGHAEKAAWTSAAAIGGWTHTEAAAAIQHLKATDQRYLEPAMITAWIRHQRQVARCTGRPIGDGSWIPSHAEVFDFWTAGMRKAGANPTDEQTKHVSEVIAQLLDGTEDAMLILEAAREAAKQLTARIEWVLEKHAREDARKWQTPFEDMPEGIPLKFIPNHRLNVRFVVDKPDFPANWRRYDPFGAESRRWLERANCGENVTVNEPTPRDLPDWVRQHLSDQRPRQHGGRLTKWEDVPGGGSPDARREEAEAWNAENDRVTAWFEADKKAWQVEQRVVVRRWYEEHPDQRPGPYDSELFAKGPQVEGWWNN